MIRITKIWLTPIIPLMRGVCPGLNLSFNDVTRVDYRIYYREERTP